MGGQADAVGAKASRNLGLKATVAFTGALAWPYLYPWPPRSPGLIETAFDELAKRWKPILDAYEDAGVDVGFELHPGEDVMDGVTFEMFLERLGNHPRCGINYDPSHFILQQLDYVEFIDFYHERIFAFHVKDGEFNPTGKQGVYSGFQGWVKRAGRFRSLGDGQVDFGAIFSKLAEYDYDRWAVLEWECALKDAERRAPREGAPFIEAHIIKVTAHAFDDFAGGTMDVKANKRALGISWRRKLSILRLAQREPRTQGAEELGSRRLTLRSKSEGPSENDSAELGEERMVSGRSDKFMGRIRLGMVGGGQGAFIGGVHRIASRIDDQYELVAGALSSDPARAKASGLEIGLRADRSYGSYRGDGAARGAAEGRHRGGRDRDAEPHAFPGGEGVPAARHPRDLRQAADGDAEGGEEARRAGGEIRLRLRADAQLHRLPDGAAGTRDGAEGRARPIQLVHAEYRAGLADDEDRDHRPQAGGMAHRSGPLRRRRVRWAISARMPTTSPASSPGSMRRASPPTFRAS